MNHRQQIESLKAQIAEHEKAIASCSHVWDEPVYEPEMIRAPTELIPVGSGEFAHLVPKGYHDVPKDRWTRECAQCGKIEEAFVKIDDKPKFL